MADRLAQLSNHLTPPSDPTRLDGQVVLITGAAQGIGRATAELLASKGAKIAINDLDEKRANVAVEALKEAGHEAFCYCGDVLDVGFPPRLIKAVVERFGKINILVNSAGFLNDAAIHKMTEEKFDTVMKIHNYTPYRMIHALSGHWMDPANRAMTKTVINISSTSGLHGAMGQINYATAKAGIIGLTKTVAAEWGRYGVRCNAVAYGWIDTRMTKPPDPDEKVVIGGQQIMSGIPLNAKKWRDTSDIAVGRPGTVEDAAGVMLFLSSPLSAYVTGTCIECTGGRYM